MIAVPKYELRVLPTPDDFDVDRYKFEIISASVYLQGRFLFVCCVFYIPPNTPKEEYMVMFNLIEKNCEKYKRNIIVLGDFNLYSCSVDVNNYFEYFLSYCGFIQRNCVDNCMGRQLDLVLVGAGVRGAVVSAGDEGLQPVDGYHPPLTISVATAAAWSPPPARTGVDTQLSHDKVWNFYKADFHALYHQLSSIDWSNLYSINDPNEAVSFLYNEINTVIDDCVPIKKRKPVN